MQTDAEKIRQDIMERVRPMIQSHRGDVEFLGVDGGTVTVRLTGALRINELCRFKTDRD